MKYIPIQIRSLDGTLLEIFGIIQEYGFTKAQAEAACRILNAEKPELTEEERDLINVLSFPVTQKVYSFLPPNLIKVFNDLSFKAFNQVYGDTNMSEIQVYGIDWKYEELFPINNPQETSEPIIKYTDHLAALEALKKPSVSVEEIAEQVMCITSTGLNMKFSREAIKSAVGSYLNTHFIGEEKKDCCCAKCNPALQGRVMFICPECGNKRCPKATDHDLQCREMTNAKA